MGSFMLRCFFLIILIMFSLVAGKARADEYAKPTWADLTRTLVRFSALNLADQNILDEYSIITECDLYKAFYRDDFKWKQVQQAVLQSARNHIAGFPTEYHYDSKFHLDRYDFKDKIFRFTQTSLIKNVNAFVIYTVEGTGCGTADVKSIPRSFRAVLADALTINGLQMPEKDGQALLKQMNEENNTDRTVYGRFYLRITYIEPLVRYASADNVQYHQSNKQLDGAVRLDARLDAVDFYADPEMTRLLYHYQP